MYFLQQSTTRVQVSVYALGLTSAWSLVLRREEYANLPTEDVMARNLADARTYKQACHVVSDWLHSL